MVSLGIGPPNRGTDLLHPFGCRCELNGELVLRSIEDVHLGGDLGEPVLDRRSTIDGNGRRIELDMPLRCIEGQFGQRAIGSRAELPQAPAQLFFRPGPVGLDDADRGLDGGEFLLEGLDTCPDPPAV